MAMKHVLTTTFRVLSKEWVQLIIITVLALVLRTYQLQTLPAALNRDEAALGYNAWLLQTMGVDEWGEQWPLALRSFGDYKLPGYPLLTILSFAIVGRSDAAVRVPSALAGSLLPLVVWYVLLQAQLSRRVRLLAAWLLAVTPFSVFYSRIGFEASVGLTILMLVIGLGIKALTLKKPHWSLSLAIALLLLAGIFTYNTPLLLAPFLLLGLVVYGIGRGWRPLVLTSLAIIVPMIIGGVLLWQLSQQKAGISIFTDPTITTQIAKQYTAANSATQRILASRWVVYGSMICKNVLASWSPVFLVTRGGSHPWHSIPQAAHLTWFSYVFGLVGVLGALRAILQKLLKHHTWSIPDRLRLLLLWLLMSGLAPAAITVDAPHATRSLLFLTLFVVFAAMGVDQVLLWINHQTPKLLCFAKIILLSWAIACSTRYLYLYFVSYPATQAMFQPGLAKILPALANSKTPILVAGDGYTYISLAWYQPIEPSQFLQTIKRHPVDTIGFAAGKSVGNYTIRPDFKTPEATQAGLLFWTDTGWQTAQLP